MQFFSLFKLLFATASIILEVNNTLFLREFLF